MLRAIAAPLHRTNNVDDGLARFHGHYLEAVLEGRHHIVGIGDLFPVAVGDFYGLLVIRNAVEKRDRLVRALGRGLYLIRPSPGAPLANASY